MGVDPLNLVTGRVTVRISQKIMESVSKHPEYRGKECPKKYEG
jgi:hypothetical protein